MKVLIDNRSGQDLPLTHIEELATFVLDAEGMPETTELSVSFVDIEEITSLNATYRDLAEPTDVLSFVLDNTMEEDEFSQFGWFGLEQILIGDVIINPDVARQHTSIDEVSFEEELWLLLIHGILHLVGYDHEDPDDLGLMEETEDRYFVSWLQRIEERQFKERLMEDIRIKDVQ